MSNLYLPIEAIIFSATEPVALADITTAMNITSDKEITENEVEKAITYLQEKYNGDDFSFSLEHIGNGYIFITKSDYNDIIIAYFQQNIKKKLSNSAMETLSIIAYEQPVIKSRIEHIRGVSCDYSIQKLLDKGLIEIIGRTKDIGKPLIYGTSIKFMEYLGINNISELPQLEDIHNNVNELGVHTESEFADTEKE